MYLLKIKQKEEKISAVILKNKYEYKEFDDIEKAMRFVFENAIYIEDYWIFKMESLSQPSMASNTPGHISITGVSGCGYFN